MLCREPCVDERAEDEKPFVLSFSKHERRLFTRVSYLQGTAIEAIAPADKRGFSKLPNKA
jgi:hypothetical protein